MECATVPELAVMDLEESLGFYLDTLGFQLDCRRPEDGFAFVALGESHIMLEQIQGRWETSQLDSATQKQNLRIEVHDVNALQKRVAKTGYPLCQPLPSANNKPGNGARDEITFQVQDPDGYLLHFCQAF